MKLLITGATGFVGKTLIQTLAEEYQITALTSKEVLSDSLCNVSYYRYSLEDEAELLTPIMHGIDVIVHLAAKVHELNSNQDLNEYIKINVDGTRKLLEAAKQSGIKRFVYLSSIKVHGEETRDRAPYNELSDLNPVDPYSISKVKSEELIISFCESNDIEYVIIRPPLIYGPNVKANFLNLMGIIYKGLPLPLRLIENKRSMIFVGNLCHAISICLNHQKATNQIFLIKDYTLSTPILISYLAKHMRKKVLQFPVPVFLLRVAASLLNKKNVIDRLAGSLEIDDSKIRSRLDWEPPISLNAAFQETVSWFLNKARI